MKEITIGDSFYCEYYGVVLKVVSVFAFKVELQHPDGYNFVTWINDIEEKADIEIW